MEERLCQGCLDRSRRIAELEADRARLLQQLDEAQRAAKRQAAPFSKGNPKKKPKKPGRKPGEDYGNKGHRLPPPPEQIDQTCEAPLPKVCPDCGGTIEESHIEHQYQTEIPRQPIQRQFNIHVGHCSLCCRRFQGRHRLQTSDALGAAASQLGPDAQAAAVDLNKQAGLSHGKVARTFKNFYGISVTPGGIAHAILRAGRRCQPVYDAIGHAVRRSDWVVPDETGWRVGGRLAWLHTLVGPQATAYVIDPTRSGAAAERILGRDYGGIMIHDGWAVYDNFEQALHQQCLAHPLRRCREMLLVATGAAVRFPRRITALFHAALDLRDRHAAGKVSAHGLAVARGRLEKALARAVLPTKTNPANERLAQHLDKHLDQLFTFLYLPGLDATNWRAEQALRPAVVNRKVWGGNRTWPGARAQEILMSVWRTCWQQGRNALDFLGQLLCGHMVPLALPP